MSTVALDRQHRWRCRLQDFSPHLQPLTSLSHPSETPPTLLPTPLQPPTSSCFPVNISPPQNPVGFKICLFPSSVPPVLGVSHNSHSSPSPPRLSSLNSTQTCNYNFLPTSSYMPTPSYLPNTSEVKEASQESQTTQQDSQSCCNYRGTRGSSSSSSSWLTVCNMHAQITTGGNLAVSSVDSATLNNRRCPSDSLCLDVDKMCLWHDFGSSTCNGALKTVPKFPEIATPAVTSTPSSSSYSVSPLVKTFSSSSVPNYLESCACFKGITTTALSLAANRQSNNNNYVSFYTSSWKYGLINSCSKSDSNLCNLRSSIKTDSIDLPKEGQLLKSKCCKKSEGILSTKARGESLTTEEDSSSFDSGQDESLESLERDPSHTNRKKRHASHTQQDENHLISQEKSLNVSESHEEILTPLLTSHEESLNQDCRANVPYTKTNSRGTLSGKTKGPGCCPRRRLVDDEGYIRRAACLCVNKDETQVLLVSSKKDRCAWLVPGGGLEVGEDPAAAATREAWEEAGVLGHINRYLGLFESYHHSGQKKHRTAVYVLTVTEEHNNFPEERLGRRREWFSTEEALLHLTHQRPLQSAYIQLMIMSRLQENGSS